MHSRGATRTLPDDQAERAKIINNYLLEPIFAFSTLVGAMVYGMLTDSTIRIGLDRRISDASYLDGIRKRRTEQKRGYCLS